MPKRGGEAEGKEMEFGNVVAYAGPWLWQGNGPSSCLGKVRFVKNLKNNPYFYISEGHIHEWKTSNV